MGCAPLFLYDRRRRALVGAEQVHEGQPRGPLSQAEERFLSQRWTQHGDEQALDLLVQSHLRLAVRIACEFRRSGPPMEDLVQEAMVGLTIAARRYDPGRATRLSTYAIYWIRACIMEHVVRSHGPVRVGTTRAQRRIFFGLGRARRQLEMHGAHVGAAELAEVLQVSEEEVAAMMPRLLSRDLELDNEKARSDGTPSPLRRLHHSAPSPEEQVSQRQEDLRQRRSFESAMRQLAPRERDILVSRYLRGCPETLSSMGERMGLSSERVRQLEVRAKARLRELCQEGGPPRRRRRPMAPKPAPRQPKLEDDDLLDLRSLPDLGDEDDSLQ